MLIKVFNNRFSLTEVMHDPFGPVWICSYDGGQ